MAGLALFKIADDISLLLSELMVENKSSFVVENERYGKLLSVEAGC